MSTTPGDRAKEDPYNEFGRGKLASQWTLPWEVLAVTGDRVRVADRHTGLIRTEHMSKVRLIEKPVTEQQALMWRNARAQEMVQS